MHREIIMPAWELRLSVVMMLLHAITLKFKLTQFKNLLFILTNFKSGAEGMRFVRMGYVNKVC
jgi:hypothetical protein